MKERPILFSGPMVRAILFGQKTVTRRVVKPQPDSFMGENGIEFDMPGWHVCVGPAKFARDFCPYGQPGDRLWVRENVYLAPPNFFGDADVTNAIDTEGRSRLVGYSASMDGDAQRTAKGYGVKQTPSIHMPRWACRLVLEVTDVRVERLHCITEEDALAEGIERDGRRFLGAVHKGRKTRDAFFTATGAFEDLWIATYGRESWDDNPWVWVVSFRRVV